MRDIVTCLQAHREHFYHLGLPKNIHRSTFADANNQRDWRIYADFAQLLISRPQRLYQNVPLDDLDLDQAIYALDGSIIELCLSLFPWANFQNSIGAVRLHVLLNLGNNIPQKVELTKTDVHELAVLKQLQIEPGAIYIMDRGYLI